MGSTSHSLCLLFLISISTFFFFFFFFNSQLMDGNANLVKEEVLGENSVGKAFRDMGVPLLKGTRVLLEKTVLVNHQLRWPMHGNEPSRYPPPAKEALTPPRNPLVPHQDHIPPIQSFESRRRSRVKSRDRGIIVAIIASVGAILVFLGVLVVLICLRIQRTRRRRSESTDKVSFDPGPYLFYINSIAPYLESDSSVKQSSESKNVVSIESVTCSPSGEGDCKEHESEAASCLDEEIIPIDSSSSDDESYHSICNSHCSCDLVSVASDENISQPSLTSSPFISPCRSPLPQYSPSNSALSPIEHPFPCNLQKSPCYSPQNFQRKASQLMFSSGIQNKESLCFPLSSQHTKPQSNDHSSKPQMTSLAQCSSLMLEAPSPPLDSESSSITKESPQSLTPSSQAGKLAPSKNEPRIIPCPSVSSLANGNVSKPPLPPPPPPPPLPSSRLASSQKGCNSSHPHPPPLPAHPQSTPIGKDGSPLPKLKPLHWDKVRAASDRSMVWDNIALSSFELDEEMIESLFGYNLRSSTKSEEAKTKISSPSKHVLEPKRLQNITILFKALNATSEQVCNALMQGSGLYMQQLEALVKMAPTKEEEENLYNYEGNANELGPSEKFLKAILKVPFVFQRIEGMLYKETFEDEVIHLKKSFSILEEACKELKSSRLFLKLLEAVLKTGNRMNVGTIRGEARAFKLDALLKLSDVKGTDGKTTLLHFVVQEIIRSKGFGASVTAVEKTIQKSKSTIAEDEEECLKILGLDLVSGLSSELSNVKKTASIDLDVLISSVSNLFNGMDHLKHLLEEDLFIDEKDGSYVQSMKSFLNHAEKTVMELKKDEELVLLHVKQTTEYYHGDTSREEGNPLRIFVIVKDFLTMLDRVCKEVGSSKIRQAPNLVMFW